MSHFATDLQIWTRSLGSLIPGKSIFRVLTPEETASFGSSSLRQLHGAVVLVFEDPVHVGSTIYPAFQMEYHYNCDDFDDRESAGTARELLMFSWSQVIKIHSYQVTMHTNTCNHSVLTFSIILLFHTWTSVLRNVENLSPHFREMLKLISAGQIKLLVLTLLRVHRTKLRMCLTLLGIGSAPTWIYAPSTQAKHHLVSRKIPASAHVAVTPQARRRIMQRTYVAE